MSAQEIFLLVTALAEGRPFHPSTAGKAANASLAVVEARSNAFFTVHAGDGKATGPLSRLEVRVPTGKGPARDGLVVLEVREAAGRGVSTKDVFARWGDRPEVRVPSPTGPRTLPVHYLYRVEWGTLSFGFSRDEPARLVEVVLDATGAR